MRSGSRLLRSASTLVLLLAWAGCRPGEPPVGPGDGGADGGETDADGEGDSGEDAGPDLRGATFCGGPVHALALVDPRLYAHLHEELHAYLAAACARRGFAIGVEGVPGLDDLEPAAVRELLRARAASLPELEGVLLVGDVPMPTFFMSRLDTPQVRFWPRYYQDLDMEPEKTIPDGAELPACAEGSDPEGYPTNWPCFVPGLWRAPLVVPEHDFDDFDQGEGYGLELWAAFMPVGYGDPARDDHESWARQLRPLLRRALEFYAAPEAFHRDLYHVGNDLNMIAQVGTVWDEVGPERIDYYGVNTLGEGACEGNPACYLRAPLEDYPSLEAFVEHARSLPWMGEGWQSPAVFLEHMNSAERFPRRVVWWNVHSTGELSLISSDQARGDIRPGAGGLVALMNGCMVGSFHAPGDPLPPDLWSIPQLAGNIMASLVYGQSAFVAAVGSIPLGTSDPLFGVLLDRIYTDSYLGAANRARSDAQDRADDWRWGYRNHQDILIGDPFVDAH